MKKKLFNFTLTLIALLTSGLTINANYSLATGRPEPGKIALKINEIKQQHNFKLYSDVFTFFGKNSDNKISETVKDYTLLKTGPDFSKILNTKPDYISVTIPNWKGTQNLSLLLFKADISPSGLTVITSSGKNESSNVPVVHYRGIIENDNFSVVAISFSENETMGMISNAEGNFVLGKMENDSRNLLIFYNDKNLVPHSNISCSTNTGQHINPNKGNNQNGNQSVNCVNWYWETDYDIYLAKNSNDSNVLAYITGIFNQVSTLYANDGITINLQTTFIWNTVDPYTGSSTGNYLNQFGANRTSFSGDLATLLGTGGGGGVAYVDGLCAANQFRQSYCGINLSFSNVPTYSWTVEVVAHEEGHLLGSEHTHDCAWNGNNTKIDACGDVAGYTVTGCPQTVPALPVAGGTIMSYCHLTSAGINFSLGFGSQPKTLILNNVNATGCLGACITCPVPAKPGNITGNSTICPSTTNTYSVAAVLGATSYTWTKPSGWTGSSTTNSISLTAGSNPGSVTVRANNACGTGLPSNLAITFSGLPFAPQTPYAVNGNSKVCPGDIKQYGISPIFGATSYNWNTPAGANITAGQGTQKITVTYDAGFLTADSIYVNGVNACGNGTSRGIYIKRNSPAQPSAITGPTTNNCNNSGVPFSVTNVSGMTYNWTVSSSLVSIASGQGSNSITANFVAPFSSANLIVSAGNACGTSTNRTLSLKAAPPAPGAITGAASVCANQQNVPYSVSPVSGATSYTWSGPSGIRFSDGVITSTTTSFTTTSSSVTANWKTTAGDVKVKANNPCASSSNKLKTVSINCKMGGTVEPNNFNFAISPNPVHDHVTVTFAVTENSVYTIKIRDLTGRELLQSTRTATQNTVNETINTNQLATGIYIIEVEIPTGRKMERIVVD